VRHAQVERVGGIANEDARLLKNQQDLDAVITQLAPNVN